MFRTCVLNLFPLYSVHFHHNCVHIMMTHRYMLTAARCSRLTTKSRQTLVRLHCSCTSHGIVLNAPRNLDGSGAWSQTTARTRLVYLTLVLVSGSTASMEGLQDQLMELAERNAELKQRLSAVENSELNINSTEKSCCRRLGRLGVYVQSPMQVNSAHAWSSSWNTRRVQQTRWTSPQHQATKSTHSCTTC